MAHKVQPQKMLMVRRLLTAGLTGIAFWNSYEHTAQWFADSGQGDARYALACIPEVGVFLVILSIALDHLSRAQKVVLAAVGAGSVSITLTANLASAGPGPAGKAAALVAPLFAIGGFCLELLGESATTPRATTPRPKGHGVSEPRVSSSAKAQGSGVMSPKAHDPGSRLNGSSVVSPSSSVSPEPKLTGSPAVSPKAQGSSAHGSRVEWALAHDEVPAATKIMAEFSVSLATAKRDRKAALATRQSAVSTN